MKVKENQFIILGQSTAYGSIVLSHIANYEMLSVLVSLVHNCVTYSVHINYSQQQDHKRGKKGHISMAPNGI